MCVYVWGDATVANLLITKKEGSNTCSIQNKSRKYNDTVSAPLTGCLRWTNVHAKQE